MPGVTNQYRVDVGNHNKWLQDNNHILDKKNQQRREDRLLLRNTSHVSVSFEPLAVDPGLMSGTKTPLNFKGVAGGVVAGLLLGCAIGSIATVIIHEKGSCDRGNEKGPVASFNRPPEFAALQIENSTNMAFTADYDVADNDGANGNNTTVCPKTENIVATNQETDSDNIPSMVYCSPSGIDCQWIGYDPFAERGSTVKKGLSIANKPTLHNGLTYCDYELANGNQIRMSLTKPS
ncbi:hypothetical protein ACQYRI_16435 [Salmonella enterica]